MIGLPVATLASHSRFMLWKNSFSPSVKMSLDPSTRLTSRNNAGDSLTGKPVSGVRAVVDNFLQKNRKLRSGITLQATQKLSYMLDPRDVSQGFGNEIAFVLARFLHPPVVRLPLVFLRIP